MKSVKLAAGVMEAMKTWELRCNNKACRRYFRVRGEPQSNTGIHCEHCGKSWQYRLIDFKLVDGGGSGCQNTN
jgi:hypothetical protein